MTDVSPALTLEGVPQHATWGPGGPPGVSAGSFVATNTGDHPVQARIVEVLLVEGDQTRPVGEVHVYRTSDDATLDAGELRVEPGSALGFRVSFAEVAVKPTWGQSLAVRLELAVGDATLASDATVHLERRDPRR